MTEFFPLQPGEVGGASYLERSRERAKRALEKIGWGAWRLPRTLTDAAYRHSVH